MTFQEEVIQAKASGKPFRTVHNCTTKENSVVYLTEEEIDYAKQATIQEEENRQIQQVNDVKKNLILKAKCISDLAFRLNKQPNQLTQEEIDNEYDRIIDIYKFLVNNKEVLK